MSESTLSQVEQFMKTLTEKELSNFTKMSSQNEFIINGRKYVYNKITVKQWREIEQLRSAWERAVAKKDTADPQEAKEAFYRIYVKCAEYYLGVSESEFENMTWTDIQSAVDACNFRTLHGSAFL